MDVIEAIRKRRSIRQYQDKGIPEETLKTILDCGRLAPSASNSQPWVFIAVRTKATKEMLMAAAGDQPALGQAPVVIVVCADPEASAAIDEDRGRTLYCLQDTAAAVENMMLAAVSLGLGTCWVGAYNETEVRRALDLPANLRPVAMFPLGYPDQERKARNLRPFEDVVQMK